MTYCQKCNDPGASLRKYESVNGTKLTMWHCDDCATPIYRFFQNEWTEFRRKLEKEREKNRKKEEEAKKAETQKKINEWKSSHCGKCGKYSNVYHYVYDIGTNNLTWSMDNASNPNQQWVFCTEDHFQEWKNEYGYVCRKCGKKGFGGYVYKRGNKDNIYERFCSDKCCEYYYAKSCDNCGCKAIGKSYYQNHINKTGTLCENCYELKKIEEELAKLNSLITCQECNKSGTVAEMDWHNPNANDGKSFCSKNCCLVHYAEKCDKCSKKIGTSEKSYYQDAKSKSGTLCQSCWESKKNKSNSNSDQDSVEEKKENNYIPTSSSNLPSQNDNSNNGDSPSFSNPFSPNSSNNNDNSNDDSMASIKCGICGKTFLGEEAECHEKNSPCATKTKTIQEIHKKVEKGLKITKEEMDNLYKGTNMPPEYKQFLQYVQRISQGEHINIESLNISKEAKKELWRIKEIYDNENEGDLNSEGSRPFFQRPGTFIGGIVILFALLLIAVVVRNRRSRKKKKTGR